MKQHKGLSEKSVSDRLAQGAAKIREAEAEKRFEEATKENGNAELPKVKVGILGSTRPIEDILKERVTVLDGHIGLTLADDTSLQEALRVLHWTTTLSDHVGFMIGDVLNFGEAKWGEKYTAALNQTGLARPTLKNYAWVARTIPPEKRQAALPFTHHLQIARLSEKTKVETMLKEVGQEADMGNVPTIEELRHKVQKLIARRKPKNASSGKDKKRKATPEPPPYEPSPDEQSKMDAAEDAAATLGDALKSGDLYRIVAKCDNKEKQRWLAMFKPFVNFHSDLDRVTGY
jgi:hypothetical protein